MRTLKYRVAGDEVTINRVETEDDLPAFRDFIRANLKALACDSESTGLDIYSGKHRMRLVQFGTPNESWVLPVERGSAYVEDAVKALRGAERLIFQNGMHDLLAFDRHYDVKLEELWPKVTDTQLIAKLIDPRPFERGGIGASLEDLIRHYIDVDLADSVKGLMTKLAKEHKTTKSRIFEKIDLDHPEYNLYAGMDPIEAARVLRAELPLVPTSAKPLIAFEHKVAEICSYMERTGFLLDIDYALDLSAKLQGEEAAAKEIAKSFGCENVNSTEQVADVLEFRGRRIRGRTPTGKRKVDKDLLESLATEGDEFARAVIDAKRAGKWRTTWVETFLDTVDEHGRCHPSINTLQARTGRMSITGIPAQTLPANDWIIRRCFIADPGHLIGSVDYQAQELRVLAALSKDTTMIQAFLDGADLHLMTAQAAFGAHITKDSPERKYAKTVNFGRVYGGGAGTVSKQTGLDYLTAKRVVDAFDHRYPNVTAYSRFLAKQAQRDGFITTPSGRRLPVDSDRAYSALNYMVQSTSRDVTCRALIRLHEAGYTPYIRLPVHDEVVVSLPEKHAARGARNIARIMREQMGPVLIDTDAEVGMRSWGSLYGAAA
ncbi:DNA polymerase [Saccharothrix sp. HUAS TT1]|uniref:DNA polymerase n=1 Tax=unclassified Saccharothrix TaxID=2593673 RepID=UPI00345B6318